VEPLAPRCNLRTKTFGSGNVLLCYQLRGDPRIADFSYVSYYVDVNGRKMPAKGLLSLATGVPVTDFYSPRASRILQKLGFVIKQE
jgi:hypothetical protein